MEVSCFVAERLQKYRRELRRFVWSSEQKCLGPYGYHTSTTILDTVPSPPDEDDLEGTGVRPFVANDDSRWPKTCSCGYVYQDADQWQQNQHRLYRDPSTGREFTLSEAPPGAMWFADWMTWTGPDGKTLVVMTPGGEWCVDGPSSNGSGWKRTGTPPNVTATPSISMPRYHGWLTNGKLISC
jgi:hypothetical protein